MTAVADKILDQILALPSDERVTVAEKLLQSLNSPVQSEIDRAWKEEAERRVNEIDSGEVELIPGEDVFSDIQERLCK